MRKIYAIYCTVELVNQPEWLDDFRKKYDEPYDFHITLKQMAYIDELDLLKIKNIFEHLLERTPFPKERLRLEFSHVELSEHDADDGGGYIYLFAEQRNELLDEFQKLIRGQLAGYSDYYLKDSRTYEFEFSPHITIARNLDAKSFEQAVGELPQRVVLTGEVTEIVLSCVNKLSIEEANKPENFIKYPL